PEGRYAIRLHFAETFDSVYQAGEREFTVQVEGSPVAERFDPFAAAGGFARPVVVEVRGVSVTDGGLTVGFQPHVQSPEINGIEVMRAEPGPLSVEQVLPAGQPEPVCGCEPVEAGDAEPREVKVLFVGHSYTLFWALPETVAALINSGQSEMRLRPSRRLHGGAPLDYFVDATDALEQIATGDYDYVVLGTHGSDAAWEAFAEAIREGGAEPMVYCTWSPRWEPPEAQEEVTRQFRARARELDAVFVPAGPAWRLSRERRPDIGLFNVEDGHHPGMMGSYLTACVFYGVLTGQSPVGHPCRATLAGQVPIEKETAAFLQETAWEAVQRFGQEDEPAD
ncbi:MAG: malectin domain-containing carbohydrate-binding protein, partial [Candidatus Brocadiia bacterium]